MKKLVKILGICMSLLLVFLVYVQVTYQQRYEAPLTGLKASRDSSVIARGKYLTTGPAHC
jgi:hypothetical protein